MPWTRSGTHEADTPRFVLEDADELLAHPPALLLGVGHALEPGEETRLRIHVDERHLEVVAEGLHYLRRLVLAQEPVVDEHTGELVADRLVHEQRGDGGIDAAREPADHPLATDLGADPLHLLLDHSGRSPGRLRARDLVQEVLEYLLPVRRVHHLRMELNPVEAPLGRLESRHGSRRRLGCHARARGRGGDGVAVAHPAGLIGGLPPKELALTDVQFRLSELGHARALDAPPQLERQQLRPVADAQGRHAQLEEARVDAGSLPGVHRGRAAAQDQSDRISAAHFRRRDRVRNELGVDATLAHPPGDELRVLAAEVEHEHGALLRLLVGSGKRQDIGHYDRR